jgi:hypothetical protein
VNKRMRKLWKSKVPMKLKIFMWLICQCRLQVGAILKRMNWKGNPNCVVCGVIETIDHICCRCPLAELTWVGLRDALGWDMSPSTLQDFFDTWLILGCSDYNV